MSSIICKGCSATCSTTTQTFRPIFPTIWMHWVTALPVPRTTQKSWSILSAAGATRASIPSMRPWTAYPLLLITFRRWWRICRWAWISCHARAIIWTMRLWMRKKPCAFFRIPPNWKTLWTAWKTYPQKHKVPWPTFQAPWTPWIPHSETPRKPAKP